MYRAIRLALLLLGCLLLTTLSILGVIFWSAIREYVVLPSRPIARRQPVITRQTPPIMPVPTMQVPPQPRRRGGQSWKEVEAIFDESRAARDQHPGWKDHPSEAYEVVANPAFTDSIGLLDHCVELSEWRREMPNSATALVAIARAHVEWAWEARGYGFASSVASENWPLFYTRLAEARRLVEQAIQLGVKDGEAYRLLISIGMGEGRPYEEVRAALDAGRKFDPTYFPLYQQFAVYLLPRWHGKQGDVAAFAKEIAADLPGDDGLEAFARIVARVHNIVGEREQIYLGEFDKSLLVKSTEVLMNRRDGRQKETELAALATWVAQDRQAALQLLPHIPDGGDEAGVWPSPQHRRDFRFWCEKEGFADTDDARWFWGSTIHSDHFVFWKDSRSVWCGLGYGPTAMNRVDVQTGRIVQSLGAPAPRVDCFAVDSNKEWVVAGLTGSLYTGIMLWDLAAPDEPWVYPMKDTCWKIAIQPTGPHIAWFSRTGISVFNIRTGREVAKIQPKDSVRAIRFSADGQLLIVSAAEHESAWDIATGELRHDMPNSRHLPRPDLVCKRILDIDEDGTIWAIADKVRPPPHQSMLVRYSPDTLAAEIVIGELTESLSGVHSILSPDRTLLAVNTIRLSKVMPRIEIDVWDVTKAKKIKHFSGHHSGLQSMSFSPDNRWLASMGFPSGMVKLWPLADEPKPPTEDEN
jgi:hypothetical protein